MKLIINRKTVRNLLLCAISFILLTIFLCDVIITKQSKPYLFDDVNDVPENKVGLVLGASKKLSDGRPNLYFQYRIDAAVELYKAGKIKYIVVSGDNSREDYNEPEDMRNELIKNGIADSLIYLDYAGFRTLDSVIRLKAIFGQQQFTVISQEFHNQRAVYIARHYGLDACGYNAKDVEKAAGFKTKLREKFARIKVFVDILIGKGPKFLGEPIEI